MGRKGSLRSQKGWNGVQQVSGLGKRRTLPFLHRGEGESGKDAADCVGFLVGS